MTNDCLGRRAFAITPLIFQLQPTFTSPNLCPPTEDPATSATSAFVPKFTGAVRGALFLSPAHINQNLHQFINITAVRNYMLPFRFDYYVFYASMCACSRLRFSLALYVCCCFVVCVLYGSGLHVSKRADACAYPGLRLREADDL